MATVMNDEQLEFDLGSDEKATNVTFGADGEPEDKSNQEATPAPRVQEEEGQSHKQELDAVNDNVQKRIAKLTARMREAEQIGRAHV